MRTLNLKISGLIATAAAAWCALAFRVAWFDGDQMIGFSPFMLFALPAAVICLVVGAMVSGHRRSPLILITSLFSSVLIALPMLNAQRITDAAWTNSISKFSETNQAAIQKVDLGASNFTNADFPDRRKMTLFPGFEWYCEQSHAAPNGTFSGFTYDSIPHVYLNKIRHGFRGIAWIPEPSTIPEGTDYEYQQSTVENWYLWKYGG